MIYILESISPLWSPLWIFDRCQEGAFAIFPFLVVSTLLLAMIALWWIVRTQILNTYLKILSSMIIFICMPMYFGLTMMIAMIIGYWGLGCSASQMFWPAVAPTVQLNAHLNHLHTFEMPLPHTEAELKAMFPQETQQIESLMPSRYEYEPETSHYHLIARPSRYLVVVYDSVTKERRIFRTPVWPRAGFTKGSGVYPETYGPLPF